MGKRGPRAVKAKKYSTSLAGDFPRPLPKMTTEASATWRRIMKSVPAGFIPPHRYGLLRAHCEATASYERAVAKMKTEGEVIETASGTVKVSPWATIAVQQAAVMTATATKLGLSWAKTRDDVGLEEKPVSRRDPTLLFGGRKK